MVVANLPATPESSSLSRSDVIAKRLGAMLAMGVDPTVLARQLGQGDRVRTDHWRKKMTRLAASNPHMREALAQGAEGRMWLALIPATDALIARAKRGRPDAVRMLWAATGFHTDKQQHEHSGEIQINVSIPRPRTTEDHVLGPGKEAESYVDAEVVEE